MNKIFITLNEPKKIKIINDIQEKKSIILFKKNKEFLNKIQYDNVVFIEELNNTIKFLDFQTKVNNTILIILDCIRYNTYPNSIYSKIERITTNTNNIIIVNDYPFVFNYRNIFIALKFIKVMNYHYKQWYDDNFYLEGLQVNSLDYIFKYFKDYFFIDNQKINYEIINWDHTEEENKKYEEKKYQVIYEKKYSKIKIVTSCQGFVNRMESKYKKLEEIVKNKKCIIITNWDTAINEIKKRMFFVKIFPTSYHQKQDNLLKLNVENVVFFETIITQKIKFYDILKCYINKNLIFFKNETIGIDKLNCEQTINNLKELNNFYDKEWKNI